jgi:multicomponent K+:H+ antiporter subunit D
MFMTAAIAATGLPPLSGFIGKLMILKATAASPDWGWAWGVILGTTFIGVIGFARVGSAIFWKSTGDDLSPVASQRRADLAAPAMALLLLAALSAGAGWVSAYAGAAAAQVVDPAAYVAAVMAEVRP